MSLKELFKSPKAVLVVALMSLSSAGFSVTQYREGANRFILEQNKLRPSLMPSVSDTIEQVRLPVKVLSTRVMKSDGDPRIENIQIKVPKDSSKIAELANKLARPKKSSKLYDYILEEAEKVKSTASDGSKRIKINKKAYQWIKPSELADQFARPHHKVEILTSDLSSNKKLKKEFFHQIQNFFSVEARRKLLEKINSKESISLEKDLLPEFARKMVKKFLVFRGPNCFHASLAFHGQEVTTSKFINVKEEEGYHRAMINYDELWRAINSSFYEVDVNNSELQYGDMLVFFDLPKDHSVTNFRWIRHAATYLIGPYTFSKGSKSPDSPYTVKTLDEEWTTWQKFSKNLGMKVFRRTGKNINRIPPIDLTDWIY